MVHPIVKLWHYPICRILLKRIKGLENIPIKTPFIIISNHEKLIDPLLVYYPIIKKLNKKIHFLAKPTWWFLGNTVCRKWAGCIPLFNSEQAFSEMKEYLKKGEIIGIFPEGYIKAKIRTPKPGAVRLALETNTPILPIGIKSSYMPFNAAINIGKLTYLKKSKKSFDEQIKLLMKEVYELKGNIS